MLINNIKKDQITARKNKDGRTTSILTTLIGKAERVGKDNGNRQPTDDEVVVVIKKFIKNMNDTLSAVKNRPDADIVTAETELELDILKQYLPQQLTEDEIKQAIVKFISTLKEKSPKQMGLVMKHLKDNYAGLYDGKSASTITKEILNGRLDRSLTNFCKISKP